MLPKSIDELHKKVCSSEANHRLKFELYDTISALPKAQRADLYRVLEPNAPLKTPSAIKVTKRVLRYLKFRCSKNVDQFCITKKCKKVTDVLSRSSPAIGSAVVTLQPDNTSDKIKETAPSLMETITHVGSKVISALIYVASKALNLLSGTALQLAKVSISACTSNVLTVSMCSAGLLTLCLYVQSMNLSQEPSLLKYACIMAISKACTHAGFINTSVKRFKAEQDLVVQNAFEVIDSNDGLSQQQKNELKNIVVGTVKNQVKPNLRGTQEQQKDVISHLTRF